MTPELAQLIGKDDLWCDIRKKNNAVSEYVQYMLDRTSQMFVYSGLPETIPSRMVEFYLQMAGFAGVTDVNGELYMLTGALGGEPDPYYRPTIFTVANPALKYSANLKVNAECAIVRNDSTRMGLLPMFTRYASQIAENDISIRSAQINARIHLLITGSTDREILSANEYIKSLEAGDLASCQESAFLEGIKPQNVSTTSANSIIQLIELQQYLKASWFNEVGLNSSFNMKREYLSTEELQANEDMLLPLVDDMLQCRQEGFELVNKMYGTNITVEKNSAWYNKEWDVDRVRREALETGGEPSPAEESV